MIRALALVALLGGVAQANDNEFDEIADTEAREANLESREPRKGLVFAASLGGGILIGGDIGVGRGPALSLRIGHVATRKTVITFEFVGNGALHKPAMSSETLTDSNVALFWGAQRYTSSPSVWVRIAGGVVSFIPDIGSGGMRESTPHGGVGGLVGGGVDIARWGYLVLGVETFGMSSVTRDGFKVQLGLGVGLSYY